MIGTIECANKSGSSVRRVSLCTPVATVAIEKATATVAQNVNSIRLFCSSGDRLDDWMCRSQTEESLKESNAVLPNITATTPTRPARAGTRARLAIGLMTTSPPEVSLDHTDR